MYDIYRRKKTDRFYGTSVKLREVFTNKESDFVIV